MPIHVRHALALAAPGCAMEGPGIQDIEDESWGIDSLRVAETRQPC